MKLNVSTIKQVNYSRKIWMNLYVYKEMKLRVKRDTWSMEHKTTN